MEDGGEVGEADDPVVGIADGDVAQAVDEGHDEGEADEEDDVEDRRQQQQRREGPFRVAQPAPFHGAHRFPVSRSK